MHLHFNPLGGLAGDMFCAAVLDAFPALYPELETAIEGLGAPVPVALALQDGPGILKGKRFLVSPAEPAIHRHTSFPEIEGLLERARLDAEVRDRALAIFRLLAEAEGRVHGIAPHEVSFHEVGNWDSITDIVAAAFLLQRLDVRGASCAPLPLGGGRVQTAHGVLPVPAPATALLLEGLPVWDDGIPGERVTPTGAAILKSLSPLPRQPGACLLSATGMGFGSRELPGIPNCLQLLFLEPRARYLSTDVDDRFHPETDRIAALGFEVDDQTPEDFALAMDHLRDMQGVLSATSWQAIGKGGRPTLRVEILSQPDRLAQVAEACFRETTTIGLRWQELPRLILSRRQRQMRVGERTVGVKLVRRPDGTTAKTENRDLDALGSHSARERLRQAGAASALEQETDLE
jgi:uncharacterized protein (TIGR00299 family) protein